MIVYGFFLKKTPAFFGSITKSFVKFGIATYFWIIVLSFRFLHSLSIVLLKSSDMAIAVQLSLITIIFLFILVSKPYVNANFRRQGINFICVFSILALEMTGRLVKGSQAVEIYLPLAICTIFAISLLSNSFYVLQ